MTRKQEAPRTTIRKQSIHVATILLIWHKPTSARSAHVRPRPGPGQVDREICIDGNTTRTPDCLFELSLDAGLPSSSSSPTPTQDHKHNDHPVCRQDAQLEQWNKAGWRNTIPFNFPTESFPARRHPGGEPRPAPPSLPAETTFLPPPLNRSRLGVIGSLCTWAGRRRCNGRIKSEKFVAVGVRTRLVAVARRRPTSRPGGRPPARGGAGDSSPPSPAGLCFVLLRADGVRWAHLDGIKWAGPNEEHTFLGFLFWARHAASLSAHNPIGFPSLSRDPASPPAAGALTAAMPVAAGEAMPPLPPLP